MKFIKTPVKGMVDMLPADMRLREHILQMIKKTYAAYGFMQIETPVMEHIENLTSKQGGDNEKLIFKVMKRGAEFQRALDAGKLELAKRAKELGYDAIHDTVHEMAKDEARHGKSFEGLLNRYFAEELKMEAFEKKLENIAKKLGLA